MENEAIENLRIENLDEQLILDVVQTAVRRGRLTSIALRDNASTALTRLNLIKEGHLCNSAAVLFGKDLMAYPQCRLRLARFKGTIKGDFIDNRQHVGNIFELVDAAMSFFFKHLNLSGTSHHRMVREDELEVPYDALREAVVNAFCHANWGYETASVGIAIYDDRIVIENAGRFPTRIFPDSLMLDEDGEGDNTSLPPNPMIANVMYLAGLIERWGRGLSMMARECKRVGLPSPRFSCDGTIVKVIFRRMNGPAITYNGHSEDTAGHSRTQQGHSGDNAYGLSLPASVLRLVRCMGEEWFTAMTLCRKMGLSSKSSFIRNYLKPAVEGGLVTPEIPEKPTAPNQRYALTIKGKAIYYGGKSSLADQHPDPQD